MEISPEKLAEFNSKYSLGREEGRGSKHFLRIKVTEGALTSQEALKIAEIAEKYGKGHLEVTNTQSIQLHWIESKNSIEIFKKLDELGFTTDKCGQAHPQPKYGDVRNICTCPVTGYDEDELINVRPFVKEMNNFFIGNEDFLDLPGKFKISVSGCRNDCARAQMWDLGLFALKNEGKIGFGAVVGGSLGPSLPGPQVAKPLNVFIPQDLVFEATKSMAKIHKKNSSRESKAKARFKWLVDKWGVERVRERLEDKIGKKLERLNYQGPKISDKEHSGVRKQKDGNYYLNLPLFGGKLSAEEFRSISHLAQKHGSGELRTTPYQNLIILDTPQEKIKTLRDDLKSLGFKIPTTNLRWEGIGCSAEFCGKAIKPYPKEAMRKVIRHLEEEFGEALKGLEIKVRATGCPNDCGLRNISNIGFLGKRMEDEELYDLYLGGRLGEGAKFSYPIYKGLELQEIKHRITYLVEEAIKEGFGTFDEFLDSHSEEELKKIGIKDDE
ncbi:hypothetical protein C9439_03420 [archaeon SCG-AAA382B04]|nr:hypothetical protein C9439_03420 [archaeon SCG-AAA382B04]